MNDDERHGGQRRDRREGDNAMLADFEYRFNQHEGTIRRAEANAALAAALRQDPSTTNARNRPRRGLWARLRRIAGTPAAA